MGSCAKFSYVIEQGIGQAKIQWGGIKNEKVLSDSQVKESDKEKIRLIEKYKKFFEDYFEKNFDDIYSKTTFLKQDAVSYMVVASPVDQVSAYKMSFPFVGEFPYLAFFKEKSALKFKGKLEKEGYETWIRPVHAYSSLGYFNDRILSSFFSYSDIELAELVFHEMTHLYFFAKNEVSFNESLAQYIAHEMLKIYLKGKASSFLVRRQESRALSKDLVPLVRELNSRYEKVKEERKDNFVEVRDSFLKGTFFNRLREYCHRIQAKKCDLETRDWNNARLAGFMNYEGYYEMISYLHQKRGGSLKDFLIFLKEEYKKKEDQGLNESFVNYLKKMDKDNGNK